MKSEHTPGPWKVVDEPDDSLIAIVRPWGSGVTPGNEPTFGSGLGAHIAQIEYTQTGVPTRERATANARLIAAAPELLEAVEAAQSILWMAEAYARGGGSHGPEMLDYAAAQTAINAAIAKVR